MNKTPALSIIIPVYNREWSITSTINSLLRSPRNDIEIIISDDGSSDNTLSVIKNINDNRIQVISSNKNKNANFARLRGVESAKSNLITFLDSDDLFLDNRIEELINHFSNTPNIDILIDSFIVYKKRKKQTLSFKKQEIDNHNLQEALIAHTIPITFSTITAKKESILKHNLIDIHFRTHQERDFLLNAINNDLSIEIGNYQSVIKNQVIDSFSRSHIGYIDGLDALVCKHAIFSKPTYHNILSYLIARTLVKSIIHINFSAIRYNLHTLKQAKCLTNTPIKHLARYFHGKKDRRSTSSWL